MDNVTPLYLMISRTETGIGRMIRAVSHYPYNHVSLTLDPTLQSWVSFARYAWDIPLYGGFIEEPAERYLAGGKAVDVRIFRLDIPADRAEHLRGLFAQAGNRDFKLIYNTFDAIASTVGRKMQIPNAYTCLSFACAVLGLQCRTIQEMDYTLTPYLIYEGPLSSLVSDSGSRSDAYFTRMGLLRGSWNTAKHFAVLSRRAFLHNQPDLISAYLR